MQHCKGKRILILDQNSSMASVLLLSILTLTPSYLQQGTDYTTSHTEQITKYPLCYIM